MIHSQLHSPRPPLSDVPAIYFVSPTLANIQRIAAVRFSTRYRVQTDSAGSQPSPILFIPPVVYLLPPTRVARGVRKLDPPSRPVRPDSSARELSA